MPLEYSFWVMEMGVPLSLETGDWDLSEMIPLVLNWRFAFVLMVFFGPAHGSVV